MMLKVKINGKTYEAEKGQYILDLCRKNNIAIPTLCHHESLSGLGACRLCVVEVNEGRGNRVVVSCVYPLGRDCEVFTETAKIKGIRRTILSMLKTRAPEGDKLAYLCETHGVTAETDSASGRFTAPKPVKEKKPAGAKEGPAEKHLASACILCGLCAQACESLGVGAVATVGRGVTKKVSTLYGEPPADCIGCGSCANVCPMKAIDCSEDKGQRTIWGKKFKLIKCVSCGKAFSTEEEYAFSLKNANVKAEAKEVREKQGILCDSCRKKKSADTLAMVFGDRK